MPYRNLAFAQGNTYHIYNRGVERQPIFREAENYLYAIRLLKKYTTELGVVIVAYCLMPNHYHFLLRQDGSQGAGLVPQRIFNSYSKAFNRRYRRTGTLFEGRYQAVHVDRDEYLLHLCRYIHANPVKAGLCSDPADWSYSNYPEWIGIRNGVLFDPALVKAHFSTAEAYREFVMDYIRGLDQLPAGLEPYLIETEVPGTSHRLA